MVTSQSGGVGVDALETDSLLPKSADEAGSSDELAPLSERILDVLRVYWYLGFIGFGGPSGSVAIFRDHLVVQKKWIDEDSFLELFALCQGLPGPTATQMIVSTAVTHAGPIGGIIAGILWTLPGALVLSFSGLFLYSFIDPKHPPIWLLGVAPAAVAIIVQAFYGFGRKLDKLGISLAMAMCVVAVMISGDERFPPTSSEFIYPCSLLLSGAITLIDSRRAHPLGTYPTSKDIDPEKTASELQLEKKIGIPLRAGVACFFAWISILIVTVTLVKVGVSNPYLEIFQVSYRVGSILFGGGIVVIPMMQNEVVPLGWVNNEQFVQGIAIAQSLPGPLSNLAAFLGGVYKGALGSILAEVGLFLPGWILIFAIVPFWSSLRHLSWFKAILNGVNAASIGIIGSACVFLYAEVVRKPADAMVFLIAGGLASFYNVPAPAIIVVGAVLGALFSSSILSLGQVPY